MQETGINKNPHAIQQYWFLHSLLVTFCFCIQKYSISYRGDLILTKKPFYHTISVHLYFQFVFNLHFCTTGIWRCWSLHLPSIYRRNSKGLRRNIPHHQATERKNSGPRLLCWWHFIHGPKQWKDDKNGSVGLLNR